MDRLTYLMVMGLRRCIATTPVAVLACVVLAGCASGSGTPPASGQGGLSGVQITSGAPASGSGPASVGATPTGPPPSGTTPTRGNSSTTKPTTTASATGRSTSKSPAPPVTGDYSVSISRAYGPKRCTWRLAPGNNGIAIGLAVRIAHTGTEGVQPVQATLTIVEAAKSVTYTVDMSDGEVADQSLEIPGFAPGTAAYTVHLIVTISPPGIDLDSSDNSDAATASVPVGTPTSTAWAGLPCT